MIRKLTSTDNPALAQAIRDLQTECADIRRAALILGAHQKGPVLGDVQNLTLRASRILPPSFTGAYMEVDLTEVPSSNTMGSSPAIHVNDGTRERVQVGNLPAYTDPSGVSSPATYGLRAMDTSGNLLFDSIGIIAVMKQVSGTIQNPAQVATAAYVVVTGSSQSFSVSRQGTFGVWFSATCSYLGTGLGTGEVDLFIDGVNNAGANSIALDWSNVTGNDTHSGLAGPFTLAAGSHTIDLRTKQTGALGTSTFTVTTFQTTAFQWGA